jgi:cell wall-associated NlpC family hydrolase
MCFGSAPQAPNIVYQGPSQAEIAANQASLDAYKSQMTQQQDLFSQQLQGQIDAANKETTDLKARYDREASAAAAAAASQQAGAYAASATESAAPANAQTTAAVMNKPKPKSSLKISTAGTPAAAGTGLNIGV